MDHHQQDMLSFRDLQNYTTLKPIKRYEVLEDEF